MIVFFPRTLEKKRQVVCSFTKMVSSKCYLHLHGWPSRRELPITGNGEGNQCSSPQQCAFSASLPGDYGLRAAYQFRVVCTMCFPLPDNDQGLLRICVAGNPGNDINKNPSGVFYSVGEQCTRS